VDAKVLVDSFEIYEFALTETGAIKEENCTSLYSINWG